MAGTGRTSGPLLNTMVEQMNRELLTQQLFDSIATGGATVSPQGNRAKTGLVVALYQDAEYKLKFKHRNYVIKEIADWLRDHKDQIPRWAHVGLWVDDQGDSYLDIVEVIDASGLARAIQHAKDRNQRAIFFLDTKTVLWLTEPVEE